MVVASLYKHAGMRRTSHFQHYGNLMVCKSRQPSCQAFLGKGENKSHEDGFPPAGSSRSLLLSSLARFLTCRARPRRNPGTQLCDYGQWQQVGVPSSSGGDVRWASAARLGSQPLPPDPSEPVTHSQPWPYGACTCVRLHAGSPGEPRASRHSMFVHTAHHRS